MWGQRGDRAKNEGQQEEEEGPKYNENSRLTTKRPATSHGSLRQTPSRSHAFKGRIANSAHTQKGLSVAIPNVSTQEASYFTPKRVSASTYPSSHQMQRSQSAQVLPDRRLPPRPSTAINNSRQSGGMSFNHSRMVSKSVKDEGHQRPASSSYTPSSAQLSFAEREKGMASADWHDLLQANRVLERELERRDAVVAVLEQRVVHTHTYA
jgi:hypothetical protein